VYKLEGIRNYPISTPTAYTRSKVVNSLAGSKAIYHISCLCTVTTQDDIKTVSFYGYNPNKCLGIWYKSFDSQADQPCYLDSMFFIENGPILFSISHNYLPLLMTISQQKDSQVFLIFHELTKEFIHGGQFIEESKVIEVHWLDHLPLLLELTAEGKLKAIGPRVQSIEEDINSFTSVLSYSMNTHAQYGWKVYWEKEGFSNMKGMLHIKTFRFIDEKKYQEVFLLFGDNSLTLVVLTIEDGSGVDTLVMNIDVHHEIGIGSDFILSKHVLKVPTSVNGSFQICLQTKSSIKVYTGQAWSESIKWKAEKTAEIPLSPETELIRINSYQMSLIAIMDHSRLIKFYNETGKYLGFINLLEIHSILRQSHTLEAKIKRIDFLFYHETNIQALIVLFNKKMAVLCNNYCYEPNLEFTVIHVLEKPVPYGIEAPIIKFEQSSTDSIILCTTQMRYLIPKEAIRIQMGRKKVYMTIKEKLHKAHEIQPLYHPELLREYLTLGDMKKLKVILMMLYKELKKCKETERKDKVMSFLGTGARGILEQSTGQKEIIREIEESDSIFSSFMNEEHKSSIKVKQSIIDHANKEEVQELLNAKDELIELIQESPCIDLTESERTELASFISNLKEFLGYQKSEDEITQEFLLHMNVFNVRCNLGQQIPISTMDVCLAYHSANQDMLLKLLLGGKVYSWEEIKRYGIVFWVKDVGKLKEIIEAVAKAEFQKSTAKDADKVSAVSIWYIMLRKKNILMNLYRNTREGKKIQDFLAHDFGEEKWKKAATRNAYQLFSQKRYIMATAFYLLGGKINEATQVAITHLHDLHLAITICRLMEKEGEEELIKLYREYYIVQGTRYADPWLVSFGNWLCGEYIESLNCITEVLGYSNPVIDNEMDIRYNIYQKEEILRPRKFTDEWIFDTPSLSTFNASMILLCRKLEKHYLVDLRLINR